MTRSGSLASSKLNCTAAAYPSGRAQPLAFLDIVRSLIEEDATPGRRVSKASGIAPKPTAPLSKRPPMGFSIADKAGNILFVNPATEVLRFSPRGIRRAYRAVYS